MKLSNEVSDPSPFVDNQLRSEYQKRCSNQTEDNLSQIRKKERYPEHEYLRLCLSEKYKFYIFPV